MRKSFLLVVICLSLQSIFAARHIPIVESSKQFELNTISISDEDKPKPKQPFSSFPPSGVYLSWRNDALMATAELFTLSIANEVNQYTTMPDYSGQTSSASFTFSQFDFDINLEGATIASGGATSLTVGWSLFDFVFVFNYHVCDSSWPNPCEDGWVQIYTTDDNTQLSASLTLDLTGPHVSLVADSVSLNFNQGDIEIYVQCTDAFCLIPVDDIANAIAGQFVTVFQTGVQTGINTAASTMVDTIATTVAIPEIPISLVLDGQFSLFPSTNPNLIISAQGMFTPDSQTSKVPPFSPDFSPPDSVFQSPSSQLDIVFTDYFIRTAIWALDLDGEFDLTITNADLPSTSPIHLKTDDSSMRGAVPGLSQFPDMDIVITTSLASISSVDISAADGIVIASSLTADFFLTNSTYNHPGWFLLVDLTFTAKITPSLNASISEIQVATTVGNWVVGVSVVNSSVGAVSATFFKAILTLGISVLSPKVPTVTVPTPSGWSVGTPVYAEADGYGDIGTPFAYTTPVPSNVCTGSSLVCPLETTCCQWSGTWGCCTLPNASCCDDGGCCPQGTSCDGQGGCQ